jgi:hypothetical protein
MRGRWRVESLSRRQVAELRKRLLADLLCGSHLSIVLSETFDEDCAMSIGRRVASAARALSANGLARPIALAAQQIG